MNKIIFVALAMLMIGCKKENQCETWIVYYEDDCGVSQQPMNSQVCGADLKDALSGKKTVVDLGICHTYRVYVRRTQ